MATAPQGQTKTASIKIAHQRLWVCLICHEVDVGPVRWGWSCKKPACMAAETCSLVGKTQALAPAIRCFLSSMVFPRRHHVYESHQTMIRECLCDISDRYMPMLACDVPRWPVSAPASTARLRMISANVWVCNHCHSVGYVSHLFTELLRHVQPETNRDTLLDYIWHDCLDIDATGSVPDIQTQVFELICSPELQNYQAEIQHIMTQAEWHWTATQHACLQALLQQAPKEAEFCQRPRKRQRRSSPQPSATTTRYPVPAMVARAGSSATNPITLE